MNKDDANNLINNLISLSNGTINLQAFIEILIPNYTDEFGNSYFHFLTEYSFNDFCVRNMKLNKNSKIISLSEYKEIKNEYIQQIKSFIQTLLEMNCDLILVNADNQSPLLLSINNKNYVIAKEYLNILQNIGIYTNEDYLDFLDTIIKNGNCFEKDCIELINLLLSNINENNIMENLTYKITTEIISLFKNFSENICEKYNEIVKIVSLEYMNKDENNNIIFKKDDDDNNINQDIKKKSFEIINDYINNDFLPIIFKLIKLGGTFQNTKESAFIYLMSYPFITDIPNLFGENKININFEDEFGDTPLIHLIKKKKYIMKISKDVYDSTFKYFMENINFDLEKKNNKIKCALYLCLKKDNFEEAKTIYKNLKGLDISFLNSILFNYIYKRIKENKKLERIFELLNEFKDEVDFNLFNAEHKRNLLHYICIYLSHDIYINIFIQLLPFIHDNLKIEYSLKDQFDRNFLFYLFLDQNDNAKIIDPIQQLKLIFEKYKFNDLNDKDIFGNNLIFYVVQSKASRCFDLLLNNGIILSSEQSNNENSIFSISLLNKDIQLFTNLYNEFGNPDVISHKVYEPYNKISYHLEKIDLEKSKNGETLYDFLNKNEFDKDNVETNDKLLKKNIKKNKLNNFNNYNNNIIFSNNFINNMINNNINNFNNNLINNMNYNNNNINFSNNFINNMINNNNNFNNYNNINNNNNFNYYNNINNNLNQNLSPVNNSKGNQPLSNDQINKISQINSQNKNFNYFNFLPDDVLINLNIFTHNIIIINDNMDKNNKKLKDLRKKSIIINFLKKNEEYIFDRLNCQRNIISENLFRYCLSNNLEDLCIFIIKKNYNLILICNELILFHRILDIKYCILRLLSENNNEQTKLINITDQKGQTIYHLIPLVEDNLNFCQILQNHNVSNIFDSEGNTPMFNACKNFNINFIKIFSQYSFDSSDNQPFDVNYNLFLETKNNKTPLEALYQQINKKDNLILKLIIDISINTKTVFFIPVVKYLIHEYNPYSTYLFKIDYKKNLNDSEYLKKVIGLYQFYTQELNENIMIKDELGNDPFIISAQNNNFDFIFNVLLEEHNISLNSTNNEGKSIIHLILELSGYLKDSKKNLLIKAIESGFDFNIKDKDGMLPIDYAYSEGDNDLANILLEYYNKLGIELKERNLPKSKLKYDYNKDSDTFYNESISVSMNIEKSENLNQLVSPMFKYDPVFSFYQVCVDETNIPFNANLVKKDFKYLNQFYDKKFCIQIIKDVNKDDEYLTIVVDNTNLKTFTFRDLNTAQQKFKDLFKEKTANDWDNVKNNRLNFKTDYNKYYIFDYTYEEENAIYDYLKITIKNLYIKKKSEYKGNIKIKNLIYYLLVKSYQFKFSIDENTKNVEENTKNVIQRYKSTAITKAISILLDLKKLLSSNNKNEIYLKKRNYLINSYNDLIPFSKKSKNLDQFYDYSNIDAELSRLTNYYYIENVLKIFLGAIYNLNNIHPLDYIINALGCKIEELQKPQNNTKLINEEDFIYNYINTTNTSKVPITAIYKITQSVNDKNFNLNNYENRYIFFHGTKVENVIGILSQGLKIAPVQAINTGKSYGTGIYLSDNFTCSLTYCSYRRLPLIGFGNNNMFNNNYFNNQHPKKLFMFMAEVAVGNIGQNADTYVLNMTMNFNDYYTTNEGYRIFKNSKKLKLGLGIIVAHEETNVRIKYLIEIN